MTLAMSRARPERQKAMSAQLSGSGTSRTSADVRFGVACGGVADIKRASPKRAMSTMVLLRALIRLNSAPGCRKRSIRVLTIPRVSHSRRV